MDTGALEEGEFCFSAAKETAPFEDTEFFFSTGKKDFPPDSLSFEPGGDSLALGWMMDLDL